MRIHLLLILLFISASILATIHIVALELSLYWIYAPLDIPMHFLGGAVISLFLFALIAMGMPIPERCRSFLAALGLVLFVGIVWEIFEVAIGVIPEQNYFADTALDIVMDLIGGAVGYFVGSRIASL